MEYVVNTIKLMLVDDHDVVRTGLRAFLQTQPGFEVIAEAKNGLQALEKAREALPDIVIMDITMPEMDGIEATQRLKNLYPDCQILVLTVHADKQYFMKIMSVGASGYLTKQAAADELVAAIQAVAAGHVYLQPALARWLLEDYQQLAKNASISNTDETVGKGRILFLSTVLSKRERQVLELVGEGLGKGLITMISARSLISVLRPLPATVNAS
jgi:DNA-binding NarL/FixJ family response regulator